jgi:pyrimidine-specific ribonucleoside hydrolase
MPIATFCATYLVFAGASLSNVDIRTQAEIIGLVALTLSPALGFFLTWHAGNPPIGLAVNFSLVVVIIGLAAMAYLAKRPADQAMPAPAAVTSGTMPAPRPVWIDTDLACGSGKTSDVDDCWALALALRSPELAVVGISTVFGNRLEGDGADAKRRAALAQTILTLAGKNVSVVDGSETDAIEGWPATPASEKMAATLARSRFTLIALGPVTNVATLLARHPALARNLQQIVMVGGKPPGRLFHPGRHWWFHFGDFNVSQDVDAMREVLAAGVPITLVPFELAMQLAITENDLQRLRNGSRLASWLVEKSAGWMSFWQGDLIDKHGFSPFDALAVGSAALPDMFHCIDARARIGFSIFLAPFGLGRDLEVVDATQSGAPVRYCRTLDAEFKSVMLERLATEPVRNSGS